MTQGQIDFFPLPRGPFAEGIGIVGGYRISSYFGGRPNPFTGVPSWHGGMDLVAARLVPQICVKDGLARQAWDSSGGGNWTRLECDDGDVFGYGHADHFVAGPGVRRFKAGDVMAYVDSTGASTGDHLHFAYQPAGWARYGDPFDLLMNCRRFVGDVAVEPEAPPTTPPEPLHPEHTPKEILAMHRYWELDGGFFAVGLEPFLSPLAVGQDGTAPNESYFVGGMYVYHFGTPAAFVLAVGQGTAPEKLDRNDPNHAELISTLESLPRIAQAR